MIQKSLLAMMAALLCTSCAVYNLEKLRNVTPVGTPYQNALAQQYLTFSAEKERRYDWDNSAYFAGKGLEAAYGKDTPPEDLSQWDIPKDKLPELEQARASLVAALTPEATEKHPEIAAMAQLYFDCWVEYQEAAWQQDEIDYCHDNFTEALTVITAPSIEAAPLPAPLPPKHKAKSHAHAKAKPAAKKPVAKKPAVSHKPVAATPPKKPVAPQEKPVSTDEYDEEMPAPLTQKPVEEKPAAAEKPAVEKTVTTKPLAAEKAAGDIASYVAFFKSGSAELSTEGKNVLDDIALSLKDTPSYDILLKNNGAPAGDVLFQLRVATVKAYLAQGGVKDDAIRVESGQSPPEKASVAKHIEIYLND